MASFPAEILLGIYLGLLVGIIPALVSWGLGFSFKYVTGVTLPGFGVTILAIALAGVNGGLLALADQSVLAAPNAPRIVTAILVIGMLSLYAHSKGDQMAADFPRRLSLSQLRDKTLSRELADFVNGGEEVRVRVSGEISDMEGYPPLPEELRARLRNAEVNLPADLRLGELERRVEDRLQTEYDLGDVAVTVDEQGRATVVAAPPFSGLSKRVDHNRHAVSVSGLIPTGLVHGDEVTVITPDAQVRGIVVSAQADTVNDSTPDIDPSSNDRVADDESARPVRKPTTSGGEGRITVAVRRTDVQPLLRASEVKVVVEPRGTRREFEVISMLRRAENRFRRVAVGQHGELTNRRLGSIDIEETYGLSVLAVRKSDGWLVTPDGDTTLDAGDELFAVGPRDALEEFEAADARTGESAI
ncbi:TrkA-C domain-containing protein [Halovenus aranensis]|uniref:TrkA-C domain-containing protein n=1 Tax=Halovenus aranensis TaxID=890420 RepID=A0A1G8TDJ8_9EURY|nr:TrkA C-terminal domain-containing protein [Halovenus aranensis]SDJ39659.1 TrkA-C domain-containing protein [Halovenus aranensis]